MWKSCKKEKSEYINLFCSNLWWWMEEWFFLKKINCLWWKAHFYKLRQECAVDGFGLDDKDWMVFGIEFVCHYFINEAPVIAREALFWIDPNLWWKKLLKLYQKQYHHNLREVILQFSKYANSFLPFSKDYFDTNANVKTGTCHQRII